MENPQAFDAVLNAIGFAARAHGGQTRKDGKTPYVSHVFRVTAIVRNLFGIADPRVLQAALLHDTIEDTTTDFDDLAEQFGADIAAWVALLSKDKRLPEQEREAKYLAGLESASWQVQLCKLADAYDNLVDSIHLSAAARARSLPRIQSYLEAFERAALPETEKARALLRARLNQS